MRYLVCTVQRVLGAPEFLRAGRVLPRLFLGAGMVGRGGLRTRVSSQSALVAVVAEKEREVDLVSVRLAQSSVLHDVFILYNRILSRGSYIGHISLDQYRVYRGEAGVGLVPRLGGAGLLLRRRSKEVVVIALL